MHIKKIFHSDSTIHYKKLSDVCNITTGRLNANKMSVTGIYPFFTCAKQVYRIDEYDFDTEALLISGNGAQVGYIHYYNGRFNAYQRTYVLNQFKENIHYVEHYMRAFLKQRILEEANISGVPYIRLSALADFVIPFPPLPVQEEIVRILDKFTLLKAELEAELEARTTQYEHYRNLLLDFSPAASDRPAFLQALLDEYCPNGITFYELQRIFHIKNGYTPSKSNPEFWTDGTIPWFRMEDIRENGGILKDSIQKVTPKAVKGTLFPKDSVIIATSATIGDHALVLVESLANQRFTYLYRKEELTNLLDPKFIFYYCFILADWCRNNVNVSGFPSVNMEGFKRFLFPVPPLPVQKAIVDILDRFESIVHDLQDGLPAEIALRQKQYEYYRDKLLSFAPAQPQNAVPSNTDNGA